MTAPTDQRIAEQAEVERIDTLMQNPTYAMAARLRGQAFLMEDSAIGHRKRVNVRTMQKVELTREQRVMVETYERSAKLMREAADLLEAPTPSTALIEGAEWQSRDGCEGAMTNDRVVYFLNRFKRDEKMLGPHEQWALDRAISAFATAPKPSSKPVLTYPDGIPGTPEYEPARFVPEHVATAPKPEPAAEGAPKRGVYEQQAHDLMHPRSGSVSAGIDADWLYRHSRPEPAPVEAGEWVMVPRVPTEAMVEAGKRGSEYQTYMGQACTKSVLGVWSAMLADAAVPSRWRKEIVAFADLMERQLRANDHKPGWRGDAPNALLDRLTEETEELRQAVSLWWSGIGSEVSRGSLSSEERREHVGFEAADVANFAMMLADRASALFPSKVFPHRITAAPKAPNGAADNGLGPHATVIGGREDGFMAVSVLVGQSVYVKQGEQLIVMDAADAPALAAALSTPSPSQPTCGIPAGMKEWNGGDGPADDWDRGPVYYANGITAQPLDAADWQRPARIPLIAYTPEKPTPTPPPSEGRAEVERLREAAMPIPDGMKRYGPQHPDYPRPPKDWDHGRVYLERESLKGGGESWRWAGGGEDYMLDWRHDASGVVPIIAYTALAPTDEKPREGGEG